MTYEFDDISRYAQGLMPDAERTAFTKALQDNPALQTEVTKEIALYRSLQETVLYNTVHAPQVADFAQVLKAAAADTAPPARPVALASRKWLWVAAAVLLGIIATTTLFYPRAALDTNALYATHFGQTCGAQTMGAVTKTIIEQAEAACCKKDWAAAKQQLQGNTSPDALLLLTRIYTETGDYDAALQTLNALSPNADLPIAWLRAGILLKQNKIPECTAILKTIISTKAKHYKDAAALMDEF
jgi:hypothetical protein